MPNPRMPHGGGNDGTQNAVTMLAFACGFAAAFLWAPVIVDKTAITFREIAIQNYGMDFLEAFEIAYFFAVHIFVFIVARVAVQIAATALIAAIAYRAFGVA